MKKIFVSSIALGCIVYTISNTFGLFKLDFYSIPNEPISYVYGYHIGSVLAKIYKIVIACFIFDQCLRWFKDEELQRS
ncbi:MAG: hypothetical protein RLZZ312_1463 [Bacteroidota bacterium]|jgi:hypothetical protein